MPFAVRRFFGFAVALAMFLPFAAQAASVQALYDFPIGVNGGGPFNTLVIDKNGMLYGTTAAGGMGNCKGGCGTAFKLDPATKKLTTLHDFAGGAEGNSVYAALTMDNAGMLYGATAAGGADPCACGTLFQLDPATKTLTTLYTFTDSEDGGRPNTVLFDHGVLYGTTLKPDGAIDCKRGCGTVFKFDPATKTFTTLHTFAGGPEGADVVAGLAADKAGVLYGVNIASGSSACACGTLFKIDPATKTLTTLYTFVVGDFGAKPNGVWFDRTGVLYGTASLSGIHDDGTLFKYDDATHKIVSLHDFDFPMGSGWYAGLVFNQKGALYGTAFAGGTHNAGTVFKFDLSKKELTTVHDFTGMVDGAAPRPALTLDKKGAFYGTTMGGGAHGAGTVFKFTP